MKLADRVVNLEPRLLEPGTGNRESAGPVQHVACPEKFSLVDLKPGSSTRRAILRHRLIEICGEKKSLSLAKVLVYGKRLF